MALSQARACRDRAMSHHDGSQAVSQVLTELEPIAIRTARPAVFITIPLSHYCEKARWGLDRLGLPYREQAHAPLLHRLATTGKSAGGTVPVLLHGRHRLGDSTQILRYADACFGGDLLYPREAALRAVVEDLVQGFDKELGVHSRRWAYAHLLSETKLLRAVWAQGLKPLQASLVPLIAPIAVRLVRSGYRVTPETARRSLDRVNAVFRGVAAVLADERPFLAGNRFSAADLSFAALASPVLFPANCGAALPRLDAVPPRMRDEVLRLRETAAGRFALRLYLNERRASAPTSHLSAGSPR